MSSSENRTSLICAITSVSVESMLADAALAAEAGADMVEFRLDYLDDVPDPDQVRNVVSSCPVPAIITCRPKREGGLYAGDEERRLKLLTAASSAGAVVDLENDVPPEDRPDGRVIRSVHFFDGVPADPHGILSDLDSGDGDISKIAFASGSAEEALLALDLACRSGKPIISLAMGEFGIASRLLASKARAFGTFVSLGIGKESAPGQPSIDEIRGLYRWDSQTPGTRICGVIGYPVGHSMSPAVHNASFEACGLDWVYVPLPVGPGEDNFNRFMDALLDGSHPDWRGLSVTIPHKENALAYVGRENCDELAFRIGAVNTITIEPDGSLRGDNTDYAAAVDSLVTAMGITRDELSGCSVAVLGAGGVARAVVAALNHYGSAVTVYNRTLSRAQALAGEFGVTAAPIADASGLEGEIVINCTSLGMYPNIDETPLSALPSSVSVVFDTIYNPAQTKLLRMAESAGCRTITGVEMFVNQAGAQFERWTGSRAPGDVMRQQILDRLQAGS